MAKSRPHSRTSVQACPRRSSGVSLSGPERYAVTNSFTVLPLRFRSSKANHALPIRRLPSASAGLGCVWCRIRAGVRRTAADPAAHEGRWVFAPPTGGRMSYTGNVEPGGRPDVRELPGLTVTKVSVGPYDNNAYILRCTATGERLLIDAANEAPRLTALIGDGPLVRIVTTHRHQDHWMALSEVVRATGAPVVAHPRDAEALPEPVAEPVEHGDTVQVGQASLEVIHLRGHTPGSIALLYDAGGEL